MHHRINFQHLAMLLILASVFWLTWQLQCISSERTGADLFFTPSSPTKNYISEAVEASEGGERKVTNFWSLRGSLVKRSMKLSSISNVEKARSSILEEPAKEGMVLPAISSEPADGAASPRTRGTPTKIKERMKFADREVSIKNVIAISESRPESAESAGSGSPKTREIVTKPEKHVGFSDPIVSDQDYNKEFVIEDKGSTTYGLDPNEDFAFWPDDHVYSLTRPH